MRITVKASGASISRACALFLACNILLPSVQASPAETQASPGLITWVEQVLSQHPQIQAAAASIEAARARLTGSGYSLYNPELGLEYERTDINTASVELVQSIDWHGKQEARERVAERGIKVASAEYDSLREQMTGELLSALAELEGSRAAVELASRQVSLLKRFAGIARDRGRAGDLGQVEIDLARIAYIEGAMMVAREQAALADALDTLYQITGSADVPQVVLPRIPADVLPRPGTPGEMAGRNPEVRVALAGASMAGAAVQRADIERRADPTVGLKGGREGDETLLGLRFSIPLQVRNDFQADVEVARNESLQASHTAEQIKRQVLARQNAAQIRFQAQQRAWELWEREGQGLLKGHLKLLERLWQVGELSTTDYLVQFRQDLDTENAGLTLHRDLWRSWITWLRAAGQAQSWLGLDGKGNEQ